MEKLLRVEAPHFVAGAIFKKVGETWKVIKCAPIISWMYKRDIKSIHEYLLRKKWLYSWS